MFAGCASEPEQPQPNGQPTQANGQASPNAPTTKEAGTNEAATKEEDDSWWPSFLRLGAPEVHRIVIQQGNVITQQMVDRLKPGMTKAQALYVMGRPVLEDLFDPDRWVYIYSVQIPDEPEIKQTLTLYFENDTLTRFTGDFTPTPTKAEGAAPATGAAPSTAAAPVEASAPAANAAPSAASAPAAAAISGEAAAPASASPEAAPAAFPAPGNTTAGAPPPPPPAG